MRPADWQELSGVLNSINKQCRKVKAASSNQGMQARDCPSFAAALELLVQLGRVTSCLLCVNGDDRSFSIARVAQAIRTTTSLLEAVIAQAVPAGLSAEVADSLARQRCEQTPLLSAATWALRQEARALFFNPRPTALSLATALLDLFREVEQLWPLGIFVPQQQELSLDATAARMADPAAQLALAMLRCAGRAMAEVGVSACRESLLCGLRVGYDMVGQISTLLDAGQLSSQEGLVKQLQQSPSLPQLMLALLAVETHRLNQQLGVSETDSCILLQPKQQEAASKRRSTSSSADAQPAAEATAPQDHPNQQRDARRLSATGSARLLSRRCSSAVESPAAGKDVQQPDPLLPAAGGLALQRTLSQQRLLKEQQLQQQLQEEEEHQEIEGAGELHQVWHQVLGMARKNLARDGQGGEQQEEQEEAPRSPLMQLWVSLGLSEGLLQLAADAGVSPAAPAQQYMAVCRVGRFLLQGSPLLQPQHGPVPQEQQRPPSPAAAAAAVPGSHGGIATQTSFPGTPANGQLSPFAGLSNRPPSRTLSHPHRASGALPQAWQGSSPGANGGHTVGTPLAAAYSLGDRFAGAVGSVGSLSPRDTLQPGGALSVSAEAAEQLMEACRDTGLKGQEQLELLRLQRVVPVVLLNTAATLLQHHAAAAAAAATTAAAGAGAGACAAHTQQQGTASLSTSASSSSDPDSLVQVVHAACTAAACVSRCWPVLQKVAEQQEELVELLAECHPPAGVYAGLTTVCWRPYTLPNEVRLPVLQLLQLVVKTIWQLLPPWQQQQQSGQPHRSPSMLALMPQQQPQPLQQQQGEELVARISSSSAVGSGTPGSCSAPQVLSPVVGECLDSLLEVLTAASKLPWEGHHTHDHHPGHAHTHAGRGDREHARPGAAAAAGDVGGGGLAAGPRALPGSMHHRLDAAEGLDDAASDTSSVLSAGDADAALVAEAWRQECEPVAAAVEACLRTAGQVAAAADGSLDWKPGGLLTTVTVSAAAAGTGAPRPAGQSQGGLVAGAGAAAAAAPKVQQRHPSAVALGSCLASLCAPFGRPGPLVAAAAAAEPGGPEQQQLFALYVSKLKVLLYNPASKKASLIAMHPIEQTPIYIIQQLCTHGGLNAAVPPASHQQYAAAAAADAARDVSSALLPWLLLLSRLMVLRGKLLGHLLATEADESGRSGATSALHTAYWHVKMAHDSASTLATQLTGTALGSPVPTEPLLALQQRQERARVQSELQLRLLPALKQAVQVLRAAMKLSRHYHETGFASGFAAGFAAGYAAAVAAASGVNGREPAAPGPVSFASPWGVLQQGCIRLLPQQLEAVGMGLAWQLQHVGCRNPLCVNLSLGSELWLIPQASGGSTCGGATSACDAASGSSSGSGAVDGNGTPCSMGPGAVGAGVDAGAAAAGAPGSGHAGLCCSCSKAAQGL